MSEILISIIMPTYNRAHCINNAITSILKQSLMDWELIIVDNESIDNTYEIVRPYLEDIRIKYFYVKKSPYPGISHYLNLGLQKARGSYIARLDDDDEWCDPDKLVKQYEFLKKNNEYVAVGGGAIMINGERKEMFKFFKREKDFEIRNNALLANPIIHNTVLFRKDIAVKLGGYNNLSFVEDWDLWLRMGKIGKLFNFKEYFLLYMNAGQNLSTENQKDAAKAILTLIKKYQNDYPHYRIGFVLNFMQYIFSLFPLFIRKKVQNFLFFIKRNYF